MDEVPLRKSGDTPAQNSFGSCAQAFAALLGLTLLFVGVPCLILGLSNLLGEDFARALPISVPAGRFQSVLLAGMGGLFTALGFIALTSWVQATLARARVGPVEVDTNPQTLRRGETFTCTVRFKPRGPVELAKATVTLAATESTTPRSQFTDDAPTHAHQQAVFQAREVLAAGRTVPAGEEVLLRVDFRIPPDAPCTLRGGNSKLLWSVAIELKLKGCPDWTRTLPLVVSP